MIHVPFLTIFSLVASNKNGMQYVTTTTENVSSQLLPGKVRTRTNTLMSSSSSSTGDVIDTTTTTKTSFVTNKQNHKNVFQLLPFGKKLSDIDESILAGKLTISCDGRIMGTDLELTHWDGNETPDRYYSDTSTEMALNYAVAILDTDESTSDATAAAVVLNNHYDTDGVLSTFACINPTVALQYKNILISGAEAGDFGEWNTDGGVKLDCSILEILRLENNNEEKAYAVAFDTLPSLLADIQNNDGNNYKYLWETGFAEATKGYEYFQCNKASLERVLGSSLIIIHEPEYLPATSIHRAMKDANVDTVATRLLRVIPSIDNTSTNNGAMTSYKYYYEKPGHGWVSKLKQRVPISSSTLGNTVATLQQLGDGWTSGGQSGFTAICQSSNCCTTVPNEIAAKIITLDPSVCD